MDERFAYDELVYNGRVAKVHKVGIRMEDGRVVHRDYIHYSNAAVILPILADRSIVMIRNYRFAVGERLWELPAGMLEDGENPAVGAARELLEETGYAAGRMEKIGHYCSAPGTSDEILHAFLASDLTPGEQDLEDYERITVEVLPEPAVRRMVASGEIHDAKTISSLALYWLREGRL